MKELKNDVKLFLDAFFIGIIGAFCAEIFILLLDFISKYTLGKIAGYIPPDTIHIFNNITNSHQYNPWLVIAVITIGGLISGLIVYTFAPEAEGHGTDTVIRAFHRTGGYLRPIVVPVKILASAITIGTGGAAGREGPTALFSAGIGSIYANWKKVSIQRRQTFVILGMAAGLSAVFKAPLGTAIFALEVLYIRSEFQSKELMFIIFGALVAYTITGFLFGWEPLFHINSNLNVTDLYIFLLIALFGIVSGIVSVFVPNIFYYTRDFFRKIPIKPHFKPAIGAFFVGIIAIWYPEVLGGGYGWIQAAINAELGLKLMLILFVLKMLAFAFTVGSGGSGGVFAPTLFIGAMFGGVFGYLLHQNVTLFALLGMASIFAAAARTPLASVIMVVEMTNGYSLLVPAILSVFFAFFVHLLIVSKFKIKYVTLYEAQLIDKSYSPIFQIDKLKDVLLCNIDLIKLPPKDIKNYKLLALLESGKPIKLPDGQYLFFGQILKNMKLKEFDHAKYLLNTRVLYIFRKGEWLHPKEVKELYKGDEVLLLGKKEDIEDLEKIFTPVSEIFSKLKIQEMAIEGIKEIKK